MTLRLVLLSPQGEDGHVDANPRQSGSLLIFLLGEGHERVSPRLDRLDSGSDQGRWRELQNSLPRSLRARIGPGDDLE